MKTRLLIAAALTAAAGLAAAPATAAHPTSSTSTHVVARKHACTHTSSGSCIRGGEFCKQSQYGQSGWDAVGRRYVCKGDHTHPHWEIP